MFVTKMLPSALWSWGAKFGLNKCTPSTLVVMYILTNHNTAQYFCLIFPTFPRELLSPDMIEIYYSGIIIICNKCRYMYDGQSSSWFTLLCTGMHFLCVPHNGAFFLHWTASKVSEFSNYSMEPRISASGEKQQSDKLLGKIKDLLRDTQKVRFCLRVILTC